MTKIVNYRLVFFIAIALFLGIFFARYIINFDALSLIIILLLALIMLIISLKQKFLKHFVCLLCVFFVGMFSFFVSYNIKTINYFDENVTYEISGRVDDSSADNYVILTNVVANEKTINNVIIYLSDGNDFHTGDILKFETQLEKVKTFELKTFNYWLYNKNICFSANLSNSIISVTTSNTTFAEKVRTTVKNILEKYMPINYSNIAYATLFGDKSEIDENILTSFREVGIAHILAVSGLHIGVITIAIMWLLKKLKLNKYFIISITTILLIFYCYLCSFTPSVIRACLMFLVLGISSLLGKRYDMLSSLGFSAIILLLIKPSYAFDASFLLSFSSVIGIALFYSRISKLFIKFKLPSFLANALALSLSAQIGIFPISINYFGNVSLVSLFTNVICIPIFEIAFILTIIATVIALVVPIAFLFSIISIIYSVLINFVNLICTFFTTTMSFGAIPFCSIVLLMILAYILGGFVNIKKKSVACIGLVVLSLFCSVLCNMPQTSTTQISYISNYSEKYIIANNRNNKSLILGNFENTIYEKYCLHYYNNFNYVISFDFSETAQKFALQNNSVYISLSDLSTYEKQVLKNDGFEINTISLVSRINGYELKYDNFSIYYAINNLEHWEEESYLSSYTHNMLFLEKDNYNYDFANFDYVVSSKQVNNAQIFNFTKSSFGNWTSEIKNGSIISRGID